MPKENLRITLIQAHLSWENKEENLKHFDDLIRPLSGKTDVVILPEMFNTGFSMNTKVLAETMNGRTILWMKEKSKELGAAIAGSLIIEEEGSFFNRFVWVEPGGKTEHYDKRHLFRMAGENEFFTAGKNRTTVEYKGWKICLMVCYDLRFPVWSRNVHFESGTNERIYDALIYVANWPEARRYPWQILLKARAIENQCYVIGVNRVGTDGKQISYSGDSAAISPKGEDIRNIKLFEESVTTVTLNAAELNDFRDKFKGWMDGDGFKII